MGSEASKQCLWNSISHRPAEICEVSRSCRRMQWCMASRESSSICLPNALLASSLLTEDRTVSNALVVFHHSIMSKARFGGRTAALVEWSRLRCSSVSAKILILLMRFNHTGQGRDQAFDADAVEGLGRPVQGLLRPLAYSADGVLSVVRRPPRYG